MLNRRELLQRGLAFGSVLALPRLAWAQGAAKEPGARTLVVLHLNGGNDGLNTVIPYADPMYRILRPGLAVDDGQVRKIDKALGLHPSLAGFETLWGKERLAIVNGVGYPNPDYSHFRATEIYYSAEPDKSPTDGWLGRALEKHPKEKPLRAVALEKERPLSLAGSVQGVVSLTDFRQFALPQGTEGTLAMYEGLKDDPGPSGAVARRALEAFAVAKRIAALQPIRNGLYGPLGEDLAKALALLKSDLDLEVIHLSFGGFDTHANQAGQHNQLLAQAGNNLRAFQEQIETLGLGDRVVTMVFSEFGRRARENLSGGTDHGSAYPCFVIGEGVKPGMHGAQPSLEDLDNDNLRFTTDFRRLYASLLKDFLQVDPKPVVGDFEPLGLLA
ncbi:MAG TPA: DUF1501 domain-containing protein [Planctomycetota bacterium]|nr:DUF1501 domain-containing protein [Planctomycetota bacterium]